MGWSTPSKRRETVLAFFRRAAPALVGKGYPGSQWLARQLKAMGHTVRIIPAQFVKPYVKSNKNDLIDAAAIAEAVTRPTMRFVEVKTEMQVDIQALHRIRDQMMASRTRLICQMRAFCLEYGVSMHLGVGKFKADLPRVLDNEDNSGASTQRQPGFRTWTMPLMTRRSSARGLASLVQRQRF